jgi:hypothetical protein
MKALLPMLATQWDDVRAPAAGVLLGDIATCWKSRILFGIALNGCPRRGNCADPDGAARSAHCPVPSPVHGRSIMKQAVTLYEFYRQQLQECDGVASTLGDVCGSAWRPAATAAATAVYEEGERTGV